jgi:putative SOS response-associated peptidase YedK
MCGRYSLASDYDIIQHRFSIDAKNLPYKQRYNIAPTQDVLTVTRTGNRNNAQFMKWGLIPSWSKDSKIGSRMINARAESLLKRRSFQKAFQYQRCLVVADGFFEWRRVGKLRIPIRIILKNAEPFGFAGLWESWKSPEGERIESCTIITTVPNNTMELIHDRMPVILTKGAEEQWLSSTNVNTAELSELLVPYPSSNMETFTISGLVNNYANDIPEVIARVY